MVSLLWLMGVALAAPSLSLAPALDVVGGAQTDLRPGLRLGFEPAPGAAIEVSGDVSPDAVWDAGLCLSGRWWFQPSQLAGEGLFLVGNVTAGLTGHRDGVGPWTGLSGGFGVRPVPGLHIQANVGPEWGFGGPSRWRTGLAVGGVFDLSKAGAGSQRHHPRKIPKG